MVLEETAELFAVCDVFEADLLVTLFEVAEVVVILGISDSDSAVVTEVSEVVTSEEMLCDEVAEVSDVVEVSEVSEESGVELPPTSGSSVQLASRLVNEITVKTNAARKAVFLLDICILLSLYIVIIILIFPIVKGFL